MACVNGNLHLVALETRNVKSGDQHGWFGARSSSHCSCWPLLVASSARKRARALGLLSWRRSSYFRGSVFTAWPSQTSQPRTWDFQRSWTTMPWGKTGPAYSTGLFKVKLCPGRSQRRGQRYWRVGGHCCEAVTMLQGGVKLTDLALTPALGWGADSDL